MILSLFLSFFFSFDFVHWQACNINKLERHLSPGDPAIRDAAT